MTSDPSRQRAYYSWRGGAASVPGSLRIAVHSLGGELASVRSFFGFDDENLAAAPREGSLLDSARRRYHLARCGVVNESPLYSLVPAPNEATAVTRLEVLKAPEVNFAVLSLYVASLVAFVYVITVCYVARKLWALDGTPLEWPLFTMLLRSVFNGLFFSLPIVYIARLALAPRVAHEQIWTACLLAISIFLQNPLTDIVSSLQSALQASHPANPLKYTQAKVNTHHSANLVVHDAVYSLVVYLYLLLSAHSYRVLDARGFTFECFYLPKLAAGSAYIFVKLLIGLKARVALGLVPFVRLLQWTFLAHSGRHSLRLTTAVFASTVMDCAFGFWILSEVSATARFLALVPYLETRTKQLGFRCFLFQSMLFCVSIVTLASILIVGLPRDYLYSIFDWSSDPLRSRFIQLEPPVGQLGLAIIYVTWNFIVAYVTLPPGPLIPYTTSAFHALSRWLPRVLVDRTQWPGWFPGSSPFGPDGDVEQAEVRRALQERTNVCDENVSGDDSDLGNGHGGGGGSPSDAFPGADMVASSEHGEVLREGAELRRPGEPANTTSSAQPTRDAIITRMVVQSLVPLRYRHREWHEPVALKVPNGPPSGIVLPAPHVPNEPPAASSVHESAGSSCVRSDRVACQEPLQVEYAEDARSQDTLDCLQRCWASPMGIPHLQPAEADPFTSPEVSAECVAFWSPTARTGEARKARLVTRKNLFVMETQVMLANASYLCYIPGNPGEEREKVPARVQSASCLVRSSRRIGDNYKHGSLADDLDELENQMEEERRLLQRAASGILDERTCACQNSIDECGAAYASNRRVAPDAEAERRRPPAPRRDDGHYFLVDPYEMAMRHGYTLFKHVSHGESNGHAVVLVGQDRVIVAFSGTRDAKNWITNSRFGRVIWDDMFPSFDYCSPAASPKPSSAAKPDKSSNSMAVDERIRMELMKSNWYRARESVLSHEKSHTANHERSSIVKGMHDEVKGSGSVSSDEPASNLSWSHPSCLGEEARALLSADTRRGNYGSVLELSSVHQTGPAGEDVGRRRTSCREREGLSCSGRMRTAESVGMGPANRRRSRSELRDSHTIRQHQARGRRPRHNDSRPKDISTAAAVLAQEFATYGCAKVHRGFAEAYGHLRREVMSALVELYGGRRLDADDEGNTGDELPGRVSVAPRFQYDADGQTIRSVEAGSCRDLPLFFCGHSLGGSLATFASFEAARYFRTIGLRRRQDVACTTFGAPMACNSVFKARYERVVATHWRFEIAGDPVPKLPGILNYAPVGVQVLLDRSGMMLIDPSLVEKLWWGTLANPYVGYRLHIRASYLMALRVYCAKYRGGAEKMDDVFWEFPVACQTKGLYPEVAVSHANTHV